MSACCSSPKREARSQNLASQHIASNTHSLTPAQRFYQLVEWVLPSVGLALLPKCPVCLAAYIALGTGVGLSLSTATYLRMLWLSVCVLSLSFLTVRLGWRVIRQSPKTKVHFDLGAKSPNWTRR